MRFCGNFRVSSSSSASASSQRPILPSRFPQNLNGWKTLAFVYGSRGRKPEARKVIDEMLRAVPGPQAWAAGAELLTAMGDAAGAEGLRADAARRFPGLSAGGGRPR